MTGKLVFENLKHKPVRSLLSIFLIAVPVTLILTLVGLSQGLLQDAAERTAGVGADVLVRPPGSSVLTLSGAPLPEKLTARLTQVPHVVVASGMITHPISQVSYVAGIDLPSFSRMSGGFDYVEGGPFRGPDDIIVDTHYARQDRLHVGDPVTGILNRTWRLAGIVRSGKLSHVFLPMNVVQELTGNTGKISQVYLKLDSKSNIPAVMADLKTLLPDYPIYSMDEFLSFFTVDNVQGGALRTFINVMQGVGVVIGFAVALLSMYMAVLQRTREIGILKSLGASRWFILKIILAEAGVMGLAGAVLGIGLSFVARWIILTLAPASLNQAIVPMWWPIAAAIAIGGVVLGALYPGLSAATQDPIEALAYE